MRLLAARNCVRFFSAVILLSLILPTVAPAQAPGATITSLDAQTGVVTARINANGQLFHCVLANRFQLKQLRPGQSIYVNLHTRQVSLDGKSPAGTIVTLLPLGKGLGGATPAQSGSTSSGNSNTSPPPPCSMPNTWPPDTADTYGKAGVAATMTCFVASCGATATIAGNIFPAGSQDWLLFRVPSSRANCANPVIDASITSSGSNLYFDVLTSISGPGVPTNNVVNFPAAVNIPLYVGLGTALSPLPPGAYYIRIHGAPGSAVGTWTLTLKG